MRKLFVAVWLLALSMTAQAQLWKYVDPRIGSVGVGRTFPGPVMPFGMVKPGPDCGVLPNAGWAPMPELVSGFSQTHVSGTGGGQKYGNILIQPCLLDKDSHAQVQTKAVRVDETVELGYYATTYDNGIRTEITTNERCAHYRFHFPTTDGALFIDATHFLGKDSVPDLRERQQFVGAEVEVVSSCEVQGYSRVRGGWNNGDAYTVYFFLQSDKPFKTPIAQAPQAPPSAPEGATLPCSQGLLTLEAPSGAVGGALVNVKMGISYVSTMQARRNIDAHGFDEQLQRLRNAWEEQLQKVQIDGTGQQKRMFYTALYHTMLMPVCKTGENPKWTESPYYDDYYAIWDTYRTSSPLLTLLWPERQVEIVNSLLNIYKREGYMPDARSGDCNGRTQGGSNAEVVIADAFVKDLGGIDYQLALEAMLKDGEQDPGADHEKHGRGGLNEYRRLGYVPYGIARAGTRTVEYAYDDYCIAQVARGLGRNDVCDEYMQRSRNWRNLWRKDYEWDDVKGYIMPRDENGMWLDSVTWGRSKVFKPRIPYTPVTKVAPWYIPWWDTFFYEALSAEYSLSIPHDVEGLIEACGGKEAFQRRLDLFFERGRYNVGNEPSFLTPCLYHWLGRPDLSTQRIRQIIADNYSDTPDGLPGNDDSGAMSSWLAFHMMGLYPNVGQDYYLLNIPLLNGYTLSLPNGKILRVKQIEKSRLSRPFTVSLNGCELKDARITHKELMQGGELVFLVRKTKKTSETSQASLTGSISSTNPVSPSTAITPNTPYEVSFTLNRQFRTWPVVFSWHGDTLGVVCKKTLYLIPRSEAEEGSNFCWKTPQDDGTVYTDVRGTFLFLSKKAITQLKEEGFFVYDGITWRREPGDESEDVFHVVADIDGTEMVIAYDSMLRLYLVREMHNNPLGIDWVILRR